MQTIDSFTTSDGMCYLLSQDNNGDYVITDSDGDRQILEGMAKAEALDVWLDKYLHLNPEDAAKYHGVCD